MTIMRPHPGDRVSADAGQPLYRLDLMTQDDVADVGRVERRCFPNPWPASAYRRELQNPAQNHYVVLRRQVRAGNGANVDNGVVAGHRSPPPARSLPRRSLLPMSRGRHPGSEDDAPGPIIGFAGMWLAFDEAHITTIGVEPEYRGQGLGELLFLCMIDEAIARGANWLTLEVRVSNLSAQALYRKYGFTVHGTRKRYYSDNNEDALIMWSRALSDPDVRAEFDRRRAALAERLATNVDQTAQSPFMHPVRQSEAR
jgi:ribosomal-protein-alanine N-acetyltransferase